MHFYEKRMECVKFYYSVSRSSASLWTNTVCYKGFFWKVRKENSCHLSKQLQIRDVGLIARQSLDIIKISVMTVVAFYIVSVEIQPLNEWEYPKKIFLIPYKATNLRSVKNWPFSVKQHLCHQILLFKCVPYFFSS